METLFFRIGGFTIRVVFYPTVFIQRKRLMNALLKERYKKFITDGKKYDYTVSFSYLEKLPVLLSPKGKEVFISLFKRKSKKSIETSYHISLFQFDFILTDIVQELLLASNGFIFHASSVVTPLGIILFMGKSGAGKSTAVKLLAKKYPLYSDDNVILRKEKETYMVYQMPLADKQFASVSSKGHALLAICFLAKSKQFSLKPLDRNEETFQKLLGQLFSRSSDMKREIISMHTFLNDFKKLYKLSFARHEADMIDLVQQLLV